jgi:hypothetical protein
MTFAEFYHRSTGWNGTDFSGPVTLIPACGSNSVLPFDGRWSLAHCIEEARYVGKRRGYLGFTLNRGEAYSRASEIRPLEKI